MTLDMVRAGISLYGYPPVECGLELKPCMQWTAKVSYVKTLPAGEYISYGRTYRTEQPTQRLPQSPAGMRMAITGLPGDRRKY